MPVVTSGNIAKFQSFAHVHVNFVVALAFKRFYYVIELILV